MFLEDAKKASSVLDITLTSRSRGKDGRIPMCGVPYHAVDSYLAKLVRNGFKIAICEQLEDPSKVKGLVKRDVVRVITPGTILDEHILDKNKNNYVCSIEVKGVFLAIACADISTGDFFVSQWETASPFESLKNELARLNPSEVLLHKENYENSELLKTIREACDGSIFPFSDWELFVNRAQEHLINHFKVGSLLGFGLEGKEYAVRAASVLLGYLKYTQKDKVYQIRELKLLGGHEFMSLDKATIVNLELSSTIRDREKRGTLLEVIDGSLTSMGGRKLRELMFKPLLNKKHIIDRHACVEELVKKAYLRAKLKDLLSQVGDVERIIARVSALLCGPADLIFLKASLVKILEVKELLKDCKSNLFKHLQKEIDANLATLIEKIESTLLEEPPFDSKSGGFVKSGVNVKLDTLRTKIKGSKEFIASLEAKEKARSGINSLKVRFNKVFGYYIEVSKTNAEHVPSDYLRKQTLVNGERFITEELKKHEEIILSAQEQMEEIEYTIFKSLCGGILEKCLVIKKASSAVALLDCLLSFAKLAISFDYVRPSIQNKGSITIINGRHPMVERLLPTGDFVPNTVTLDLHTNQMLILTGPNMSGKSVFVRQIALICLLNQMGSFVPASKASLCIVDKIFVRSGASDVISSGLSTFMVEMVETANILNNATKNSLVIMDEVGRGTSTYDGISIAWAVCEYLLENDWGKTPKTLFATHYHELQKLEELLPRKVKNFQVAVKEIDGSPVFIHRVVRGGASHSYGIAVASLAGVPKEVTSRALHILNELEAVKAQGSFVDFSKELDTLNVKLKELKKKIVVVK